MAGNVDQRIVQMRFENAQFERNIAKSKKSLDDFKQALNFADVSKGLQNFFEQTKNFSFDKLANGVQALADRFTGLGNIAEMVTAQIRNRVEGVISTVSNFVDSMTTAQIDAGKSKYELLNKSVQTIMNATSKSEKDVYAVMERLNRYTDQTSYDFADMAQNIGKFTSVGRGLEESERAMEGIANWAALSGAGINEASRAMYNISQAMGVGKMTLMDWKSIQNANMATMEFKQAAMDAAVASGDLVKAEKGGETVYKTASKYGKETTVTLENFQETLNKGWFTSDVMIDVLEQFADTTTELGKKAYEAAQKCTTFTDVLQAWRDQISTGWMNSFRLIFGDLTESMAFFSDVCNKVADDLGVLIEARNSILKFWAKGGGRKNLFEMILGDYGEGVETGAYGLLDVFHDIGKTVGNAFIDMMGLFAPGDVMEAGKNDPNWYFAWLGLQLRKFTNNVHDFIQGIRSFFTDEVDIGGVMTTRGEMIANVLRGIAGAFVYAYNVIKGIIAFFHEIRTQLTPMFLSIEYLFSQLGASIYESAGEENKNQGILGFFLNLAELTKPLTSILTTVVGQIISLVLAVIEWGNQNGIFEKIGDGITSLYNTLVKLATPIMQFVGHIFETITELFENGLNEGSLKNAGTKLKIYFKTMLLEIADTLPKSLGNIIKDLFGLWDPEQAAGRDNLFTKLYNLFTKGFGALEALVEDGTISGIWDSIKELFSNGLEGVESVIDSVYNWFDKLTLGDAIKGTVGGITTVIGWLLDQLKNRNLFTLVKGILGVMAAGKLYKTIGSAQKAMGAIGDFFKNPLKKLFGGSDDGGGFGEIVDKILDVAKAIALIAGAIIVLGAIPTDQLVKGGLTMTALMGVIVGFIAAVNAVSGAGLKSSFNYIAIAGIAISIGLLVAALLPLTLVSWEGFGKMMAGLGGILLQLVGFMLLTTYLPIGTRQLGSFIGFALSIMLLVTSLLPLSMISWEGFGRMMAGLGGVLLQLIGFMLLTKYLPIGTAQLGGFIGFALSIMLLVMTLLPLTMVSWEGFGKMMAGLGGVLLQLIAFMLITTYLPIGTGSLGGFIGFAASIAILMLSLLPLANVTWDGYVRMMAGLAGVLGQLILMMMLVNSIKLNPGALANMILFAGGLSVIMLAFGVSLAMVKGMDWSTIAAFAAGLSVLLIGMAMAMAIAGNINIVAGVKGLLLLAAGMVVIMGVLSAMIPVLMGSIGGSLESLAGKLRSVANLFSEFTGIMGSIGDGDIDSAQSKFDRMKALLQSLSGFRGLEADADAFMVAMWTLGSALEMFWNHASEVGDLSSLGALDLLKQINENYTGIDTLAKINLSNLQANISGLGGAMMLYAMGVQKVAEAEGNTEGYEVNQSAISAAVQIMQKIAETMVEEGGFTIPEMPSETALSNWGSQLAALAGALVQFEQAGSGLGAGTDKALNALSFFSELKTKLEETTFKENMEWVAEYMASYTDEEGKLIVAGTGEALSTPVDALTSFGAHIEALGGAMKKFAQATNVINKETGEITPIDYTKATEALQAFLDIKTKLPEVGGIFDWVTGTKKDLTDLGIEIENLASSLMTMSKRITGEEAGSNGVKFDMKAVTAATRTLDKIREAIAKYNEDIPALTSSWTPGNLGLQLEELGAGVGSLGTGLMKFSNNTTGVSGEGAIPFDEGAVNTAVTAMDTILTSVTSIGAKLDPVGGIANWFNELWNGHKMTITEMATHLNELGGSLGQLGSGFANEGWQNATAVETAMSAMTSILDAVTRISELNNIQGRIGSTETWMEDLEIFLGGFTSEWMGGTDFQMHHPLIEGLKSFMQELDTAMTDIAPDTAKLESVSMVAEILNNLSNVDVTADFSVIGLQIAYGVAQGINDGCGYVTITAVNMAIQAYNAACEALGIASPSKLFAGMGEFVAIGMANGIASESGTVVGASENMANSAIQGAADVISIMGSMLDQDLDANPTISPVLDLTGFNSGMGIMQQAMSRNSMTIDTSAAGWYAMNSMPNRSRQEINQNGSDYSGLYDRIEQAVQQIGELGEQMSNMKLVLDSGVVAGGVSRGVDEHIGRQMFYASRNN